MLANRRDNESNKKTNRAALSGTRGMVLLVAGWFVGGGVFEARAAESASLRASYSGVSGAFAPVWIAAEKGFFAKYGLPVDLRYIAPGTSTQALLAKSLDIVNPGGEIIEAGLN